jgi:hypothetical protein
MMARTFSLGAGARHLTPRIARRHDQLADQVGPPEDHVLCHGAAQRPAE